MPVLSIVCVDENQEGAHSTLGSFLQDVMDLRSILTKCLVNYRPQLSCGKVIFSQASVILSRGGDGSVSHHALGQTQPTGTHLGRHHPPGNPTATAASYWNAFLWLIFLTNVFNLTTEFSKNSNYF